jgi:hypothetical protein
MSGLDDAMKFYVAERHGTPLLLVHSVGGIPEVATANHPLLRVSYLSPESAASEQASLTRRRRFKTNTPSCC